MSPLIPELTTQRLILRDVRLADPVAYVANFADYEVVRQLAAVIPWPYPPNGFADFLATRITPGQGKTCWCWALHLKTAPAEPIGNIDLRGGNAAENRGFWLARKHWGHDYMSEATDAVTDYAFDHLGFTKLTISNAVGNHASRRIKQKAGAVFLRTEPFKFVDPALTQREVWELTKTAWKNRQSLIV
jgi:RimJ/RimL family protein N-acetyltransferase